MILYRLATAKYADDLSGEGARLYGGRFNPVGIPAVYTSGNVSLCILEILVRASRHTAPDSYTLISIEIPDTDIREIKQDKLKKDWQNDLDYTQGIGEDFLKENKDLCLKVPSAVLPIEHNYVLNPAQAGFKKVKIIATQLLQLDKRLFKK
ncbi:MAG: RES family NAD+ phosphorylase [Ginsengibacter sp.]|jgi:RES domain-containing protein